MFKYRNSTINAARSRIQEPGGEPDQAAAKALFELSLEEYGYQALLSVHNLKNSEALLSRHQAHDDSSDSSENFKLLGELVQQNQDLIKFSES